MSDNKTVFYVGCYTNKSPNGIYQCEFDYETEKLSVVHEYQIENASYITTSHDKKYLYAAIENESTNGIYGGAVASYKINSNGSLTPLNQLTTNGRHTCHVSVSLDDKFLFAANYSEGTVCIYNLLENGEIDKLIHTIKHSGSSVNKSRQDNAYAHFAMELKDIGLCVCDLGLDKVIIYTTENDYVDVIIKEELNATPGSGPRHSVYDSDRKKFYVVNEMTCDIDVYDCLDRNSISHIQKINSIKESQIIEAYTCAAIRFSKNKEYICTSNRGLHSISVFQIDEQSGELTKISETSTFGENPRDFDFDESGKYIFCANQDSGSVTAFKFDDKTGDVSKIRTELMLAKPVCILI